MNSPAGRNRYTREQFIAFLAAWLRQQPDLTLQVARAEGMKSGFTVGRREFDEARKASLAPPVVPGETPAAQATPADDLPRAAAPRRDDSFGAMPADEADEPVVTFPPAAPTNRPSAAPPAAAPEAPLPSYLSARHVPTPPSEPSTFAPKPGYTTRPTSYDRPTASSYDRPASSSYDRPANYDRPSSYDRQTPVDRPGGRNDGPRRFATSFDDAMRDLSSSDAPSGWASRTVAPSSGAPAPTTRPVSQPATSGTAPPAGPDGSSRSNQSAAPPQARSVAPTATPSVTPTAQRVAPSSAAASPTAASSPTAAPASAAAAASPESSSWLVGTVAKKPEATFAEVRAAAVAAGHTAPSPIAFARARRSAAAAAARASSGRGAARSAASAPTPRKGGKAESPTPHSPAEVVEEIRRVSDERARLLEALKRIAKLVDRQGF